MFKKLETAAKGTTRDLDEVLDYVKFNGDGLIPAIAQQHDTGEVLMMAWMNIKALRETLRTGRVCYWSRSREAYWRKGEESGNVQTLKELRLDCDGDTILLKVDQQGPACHSGRRNCFYNHVHDRVLEVTDEPLVDPEDMYS